MIECNPLNQTHNWVRMNAGVIHDVNNLMQAVIGMADMMAKEVPVGHASGKRAKKIIEAVRKCSVMLTSPIPTSQYRGDIRKTTAINPLIREVVSWLKLSGKSANVVATIKETENIAFFGHAVDISAVLMNLCLNAVEAMPGGGGTIRIRTYMANARGMDFHVECSVKAARYIHIDISDIGTGMSAERIRHIFGPHQSTKAVSEKTRRGLGLSRVWECVRFHGGTVKVKSAPNEGTTFTIVLPESDVINAGLKVSIYGHIPALRKIIIIDRDEMMREVMSSMLDHLGVAVVKHPDASSAISWIADHTGETSLAIVEYAMTGQNGITCINAMKKIDPEIRYVICSDFIDTALRKGCDTPLLVKPFLRADLCEAIDCALKGPIVRVIPSQCELGAISSSIKAYTIENGIGK